MGMGVCTLTDSVTGLTATMEGPVSGFTAWLQANTDLLVARAAANATDFAAVRSAWVSDKKDAPK
jgi:hypothetical protein